MVGKYERKIAAVPHARLANTDSYFWIFALYFSGYNPKGISDYLGLPRQTVNRNLKKLRQTFLSSSRPFEVLSDEAHKSRLASAQAYMWILTGTQAHIELNPADGAKHLFGCFKQCPRAQTPNAFEQANLGYHVEQNHAPFTILPMLHPGVSLQNLHHHLAKRHGCVACPFGKTRENLAANFIRHPEIYFDLMHYLATHRTRDNEEFADHIIMALYIGWARQIGEQRHYACAKRELDEATTYKIIARNHLRLRRMLFRTLETPVPSSAPLVRNILYEARTNPEA